MRHATRNVGRPLNTVVFATFAALLVLGSPAAGAASLVQPAFTLTYDADTWRERTAVPPALAALDCIAPRCASAMVQVVGDGRPLPMPGVSRFTPGALGFAIAVLRTSAPGHALALEDSVPVRLGGRPAVRTRFALVAPDLRRSALVDVLISAPPGALHILLSAPALTPSALAAFDHLLAGFRLGGG